MFFRLYGSRMSTVLDHDQRGRSNGLGLHPLVWLVASAAGLLADWALLTDGWRHDAARTTIWWIFPRSTGPILGWLRRSRPLGTLQRGTVHAGLTDAHLVDRGARTLSSGLPRPL
jgi:hypothetical protein